MVATIALIILAIAVLTGIIAVVMVRKGEKEGKPRTDYRVFYILGVIWVPFSIVLMVVSFVVQIPFYIGLPLLVLGLVYLIIGLKNRDKWKKNQI